MGKLVALSRQHDGRWIGILGKASFRAIPDKAQVSFFAPDFSLNSQAPWIVAEESFLWDGPTLRGFLHSKMPQQNLSLHLLAEPDYSSFSSVHQEILKLIQSNELKKIVPTVFSKWNFVGDLGSGALALLDSSANLWPYGFELLNEGMLGLTPEVLFEKRDLKVKTQAVAGTQKLTGPSLFLDPKEMLEHELVVQDLTAQLKDLGQVEVAKTEERPAGQMKHLVTDITLELDEDVEFIDLVKRLHPSAALGGFPRDKARAWFAAHGDLQIRKRFGAPFGWRLPNGDGVCLVAIRNLQWQGNEALIGSGCGVVEGSVAEREWQELALKRMAIVNALKVNL